MADDDTRPARPPPFRNETGLTRLPQHARHLPLDATGRFEILELCARYANTIDDGDAAGWADCFTADGVLVLASRGREVRGRTELAAFATTWWRSDPSPRRHVSWHHVLTPDGDEVLGRCSAALLSTSEEGVRVEFTAVYRDRFTRADGAWRIRERVVELDRPG